MATLDFEKKKKGRKRKKILCSIIFLTSMLTMPYVTGYLDKLLKLRFQYSKVDVKYWESMQSLMHNKNQLELFLISEILISGALIFFIFEEHASIGTTKMMRVTDKLEIPQAVGQGQHGTAQFLQDSEKKKVFHTIQYPNKSGYKQENLGLVLGMTSEEKKEVIFCVEDDLHAIVIGATRSGKTRGAILQSIWLRGKTGKSMVVSDPKGELYLYCSEYLKEMGYEVIDFDLRQPLKGRHYNYLESINLSVEESDIPAAIDKTWDLVSVMVGIPKGEPLWSNGESAVIAASILAVALEAPKEYRNLANVYYFLANMCKSDEYGQMPITTYFKDLPDVHPAKGIFAVAEISPERTRGSFFGSALATLRLFTNWNIADMTSQSDFDLKDIGRKPTALFVIIPDEKTTFYSLVSLFINQVYVNLVELANENGGRVPNDVDFFMDEFGNFPAIPSFGSMLSVGAGRGLRFTLVLQDYQQLEKHYKEDCENIKGNCVITLYLKTPTQKTLEELSKRTGTYTVQVNSTNNSLSGNKRRMNNASYSDSANMQSRALLMPDEIGRIDRPYSLVFYSGKYPAIMCAPDLSAYRANKELGLGDKEHNKNVIMDRDQSRKQRDRAELKLWAIWNDFNVEGEEEEEIVEKKRISFLD